MAALFLRKLRILTKIYFQQYNYDEIVYERIVLLYGQNRKERNMVKNCLLQILIITSCNYMIYSQDMADIHYALSYRRQNTFIFQDFDKNPKITPLGPNRTKMEVIRTPIVIAGNDSKTTHDENGVSLLIAEGDEQKFEYFNYDLWLMKDRSIFMVAVSRLQNCNKEEKRYHPKIYSVTPLAWSLEIEDTNPKDDGGGAGFPPSFSESCICLIRNALNSKSFFICFARWQSSYQGSAQWEVLPTVDNSNEKPSFLYLIDEKRDYCEQWKDYLKSASFGPNNWGEARCVSVVLFEESTGANDAFDFPLISTEEKQIKREIYLKYFRLY